MNRLANAAHRARRAARDHPPATAAGLTGAVATLLVRLADWGLDAVAVPDGVAQAAEAVAVIVAMLVGAAIGKAAERWTWPDETHRAAAAYALFKQAPRSDEEAEGYLQALGVGSVREAAELIGLDVDEEA
ncbi:hypothetical protein ER308_07225 [Egibacter rhizosphaerae]|uniref:Uncharacterized protein n=1 Tax=Egibacter rhizosphaerae TaxID=1670831 RepID=A0A411YDV1_9ACTN|nr:hypothetical protein [Egibacter rhizosphaerae]QBI19356.1 hypothetical protein ER308_07225 [Egibacter rhizosphaerae]